MMKADKTRRFLRYYFPFNENFPFSKDIAREKEIENLEKEGVLIELKELESKAQELDRREKGLTVGNDNGRTYCKSCLSTAKAYQVYCPDCGTKLIWKEV